MPKWNSLELKADTGCWLWTGKRDPKGYGMVTIDGKMRLAHRQAYTDMKGTIPDGKLVRHVCGCKSCCNPDHLEVGTREDNYDDAASAGTFKARLPRELVLRIYRAEGGERSIAREFGVHYGAVRRIKRGIAYRSITGAQKRARDRIRVWACALRTGDPTSDPRDGQPERSCPCVAEQCGQNRGDVVRTL